MSEPGYDDGSLDDSAGLSGTVTDTDGDGFFDTIEIDTDGDGLVDTIGYDTDGDGAIDIADVDTNADGTFDTVVDDTDYAAEAGDGGAWISQGRLSLPQFRARVDALACEVVAGTQPARLQADDRIVALLQGMAAGDIAFAAHALREAERSHRGTLVELP